MKRLVAFVLLLGGLSVPARAQVACGGATSGGGCSGGGGSVAATPTPIPPGGSDTHVQFNDGGAFGGDAGMTYAKATDVLSIGVVRAGSGGGGGIVYSAPGVTTTGMGFVSSSIGLLFNVSGSTKLYLTGNGTYTANASQLGWTSSTGDANPATDAHWNREAAGVIQFGTDSGTPTPYTQHGSDATGTDIAGSNLTVGAGRGTGTAAGGDYRVQRSPSIATGTTVQTFTDAQLIRSQMKALTDGVATAIVRITVPQGVAGLTGWTGGHLFATVVANDGTNYQAVSTSANFAFVNEAGTEACNNIGTATGLADGTPTGTLTVTVTGASNAADTCDLLLNAASSLTETTLAAFYSITLNGPGTMTPQ